LIFNLSNAFVFSIGSFPFAMLGAFILFIPTCFISKKLNKTEVKQKKEKNTIGNNLTLIGIFSFVLFQLFTPFRSLLIEGNVFWTAEGKIYAWHMMSSSNSIESRKFTIIEYSDDRKYILKETPLDAEKFLNRKQLRTITKYPMVIPQFAQFLKKEAELSGFKNVGIKGELLMSKNFREKHYMVDPDLDLTTIRSNIYKHDDWILLYERESGIFK
jgi:hypothetical protein